MVGAHDRSPAPDAPPSASLLSAGAWERYSDAELVERALANDRWAKEAIFRRYAPAVAAAVVRLLGDGDEGQDVIQDTFIAAFERLAQLRDPSALRPWLVRIGISHVQRRFRRRKLLRALGMDRSGAHLHEQAAPGIGPEQRAELARLDAVLQTLPANQRIAWVLRHVEGYRLREVAEACDCSLAAVKRRVTAAQRAIGARLRTTGEPHA